ncbi:MAG: hypothetical protein ACR2NK_02880 [Mariniblastus sp.]
MMINEITESMHLALSDPSQLSRIASLSQGIPGLSSEDVDLLLERLLEFGDDLQAAPEVPSEGALKVDQLIQPVIHQLIQRETKLNAESDSDESWTPSRFQSVQSLYRLAPNESDLRNHLLRWMAVEGSEEALQIWTDLICDDPPEHRVGIVLAFAPLMQTDFEPSSWMLSQLLNHGTSHSQIAPAIFDLFNYYYRHQKVEDHPAIERINELTDLLGLLAGQLGKIEDGKFPEGLGVSEINQLVSDSVALIVALCDTFAQLEHEPAIGKLNQTLELRHRRVQTEAAAALARLNDESGKKVLIQLAEQPVARLRVLAYAEELGIKDEISLEFQGEIAMAESHLAIWLAEPAQMGLAPSGLKFLESREFYWPSYEHPVHCYLFEYHYGSDDQMHRNIGISGPLTHAFAADLKHLEVDEIYAAFAGWQTIHHEIYQISLHRAQQTFSNEYRRLISNLEAEAYDEHQPLTAASFFGELLLIADATKNGQKGTAIVDANQTIWFSEGNAEAPIDSTMAYTIWRGKQLLANFNENEAN